MPTTPIRLERFLPYRLSVLSNIVSSAIAAAYRQRFALTIPEWRVLAVLARYPGLAAREVAERTQMDAVAVSRAVTRLLRDGRLRRTRARADRRRSVLQVSDAGAAVYGKIAPLALRYEQALLDGLTPAERASVDRALGKLTERARLLARQLESGPATDARSGSSVRRLRKRRAP